MDITFRSDMKVELVKHSANDSDVIAAARVSTFGERLKETTSPSEARGLINFLMRERHGSPFEHSYFTFYVEAPIFVWREHMRHRIASYNEESARYRELAPVFYVPAVGRKLTQTGKPGNYVFEEGTEEQQLAAESGIKTAAKTAYFEYQMMLRAGIAREVARMSLPVSIYSSAYVTMNARAMMNFLSLRRNTPDNKVPSYPQREIEMVAEQYETYFASTMSLTHSAFIANGRVAP